MNEPNSKLNEPSDPSDRWFILLLVSLNYFTIYLHRQVINFVLPPLKVELDLSEAQLGWLNPALVIPYGVAQLFVGYLSDRFQRRNILIYSLTGSVLLLGAMAWANGFWQLVLFRAALGLAQAASVPAIGGIMADCFSPKIRSTAVAIYLMSYNAAVITAGWAGGSIAEIPSVDLPLVGDMSGWRTAMLSFSLIGAVLVVILTLFLREPERTERSQGKTGTTAEGSRGYLATLWSVLRVPSFWILGIIFLLFALVMTARDSFLPKYFHDTFGMSEGEAGHFSTVWIQFSSIVGLLLGGVIADRWSRRWQGGRAATCAVALVPWVPALLIIGTMAGGVFSSAGDLTISNSEVTWKGELPEDPTSYKLYLDAAADAPGAEAVLRVVEVSDAQAMKWKVEVITGSLVDGAFTGPGRLIIEHWKWTLAGAMILFGLGLGVYSTNLWTTTFEIVDPAARSTSLGLLNVFSSGPAFAAPVIGSLMDRGIIQTYGTAFAAMGGVALLILVLYALHIWVTLPRDFIGPETKSE